MKLILFLIVAAFFGCSLPNSKRTKPFVIIYKNVTYTKGVGHYIYQDVNGNTSDFSDTPESYKIGDTIK